jgi:hypothetical protein
MVGWGYLYSSLSIIVVGQKAAISIDGCTEQSGAHQTCTVHYLVPWPRQPIVRVYNSRPFNLTIVRLSGAHQIVRCYSPRAPDCEPLYADCLVTHRTVQCTPERLLFTVRCTTSALADCPLHGYFCHSLGLLLFLSLGLLCFFYVFF